jgi:hypothetical protein
MAPAWERQTSKVIFGSKIGHAARSRATASGSQPATPARKSSNQLLNTRLFGKLNAAISYRMPTGGRGASWMSPNGERKTGKSRFPVFDHPGGIRHGAKSASRAAANAASY